MEEKFSIWLVKAEGKIEATGRSYSNAIHRISEHYSSHTGIPTNIYQADNSELRRIKNQYETDGKFAEFGHESHGLYRAAIKALYRYRQSHPAPRKTKTSEVNQSVYTKPRDTQIPVKRKPKSKSVFQKIYEFIH